MSYFLRQMKLYDFFIDTVSEKVFKLTVLPTFFMSDSLQSHGLYNP